MSAAIIADNTTIKNIQLPYGNYSFPTNASSDIFTVPNGATYKLTGLIFDSASIGGSSLIMYIKTPGGTTFDLSTNLKAPLAATNHDTTQGALNPLAQIILSPNVNPNYFIFKTPIILTSGYALGFRVAGGGAAGRLFAALGEATQNTP